MPAPLDVDREQVRMLVQTHGCTEAAKMTGIKLATILQWSSRGNWLKELRLPPKLPPSMTPTPVIGVISPADAQAESMRDDSQATRLAGLRFSRRTVEAAAELAKDKPLDALEMAQNVKASLQGAALAGDWQAAQQRTDLRISIFAAPQERPVVDI